MNERSSSTHHSEINQQVGRERESPLLWEPGAPGLEHSEFQAVCKCESGTLAIDAALPGLSQRKQPLVCILVSGGGAERSSHSACVSRVCI